MVWLLAACPLFSQTRSAPQLYEVRGRVLAESVDSPVVRAQIEFFHALDYKPGDRPKAPYEFEAFTDGKGEFLALLPAGDYVYFVKSEDYTVETPGRLTILVGKTPGPMTIRMPRAATIAGVVEDAAGNGVAGVSVAAVDTSKTGAPRGSEITGSNGKFTIRSLLPGSYVIRVSAVRTSLEDTSNFLTTYYPGTTDSFAAGEITLSGADLTDLRLRMQQAEFRSVSGVVSGREGNPSAVKFVMLRPILDPRVGYELFGRLAPRGTIDEDGTFSIDNVPPGRYTATVEGDRGLPSAAAEITVLDRDIEDLRIEVAPGGLLAGKFVGENGKLPNDWEYTILAGQTAAGSVRTQLTIKRDGSFSLDGVSAGAYALSLNARTGTGFSVKSVEIGGRKYEGSKFPFVPGSGDVVVTVGEGGALIQGTLAGSRKPDEFVTGTVTAVMMSGFADGLTYMRKVNLARNGTFTFIDLEVGKYLVCAWTDYSARTDRLLTLGTPPVARLQELCKTVELKAGGFESVELRQISLAEVNGR